MSKFIRVNCDVINADHIIKVSNVYRNISKHGVIGYTFKIKTTDGNLYIGLEYDSACDNQKYYSEEVVKKEHARILACLEISSEDYGYILLSTEGK